MYRTEFWTLWEKARVGCFERTASKHVYYQGWNRLPAQAGCMRQVFGPGALGRPRGIGWRGRWERGSGWGTHVTPWLIHVNVWQNPLQCCEVISRQLIKINGKKKNIMPIRDEEKRGSCILYFCFVKIKVFCIPNEILSSTLDFPRLGRCDFLTSESNPLHASRIFLSFSLLWDYISWF